MIIYSYHFACMRFHCNHPIAKEGNKSHTRLTWCVMRFVCRSQFRSFVGRFHTFVLAVYHSIASVSTFRPDLSKWHEGTIIGIDLTCQVDNGTG
jgi:hypothetical protein